MPCYRYAKYNEMLGVKIQRYICKLLPIIMVFLVVVASDMQNDMN